MTSLPRIAAMLLMSIACAAASAQNYPNHPIKLVVGFSPGGAADTVARAMSDAMGKSLGQTVVVDNRPGAGSSLAAEFVAKAPPDGYTVLIASPSSISVNPALSPKLGYKFSDLQPVLKITSSPLVIAASPSSGFVTVKDLIAAAKKAPGSVNYATSGVGSAPHLGAELFAQVAGVKMFHVPFKGGSQAVQSVVAGDTQVTFGTPPSVLGLVQGGRLRGLGVSTRERSPLVPGLPGMVEAGLPDYVLDFWYGIFVPAGTPEAVSRKIFDAATVALQQRSVAQALALEGTEVSLSASVQDFKNFLEKDNLFWARLVKSANVSKD
ncbi:Bug family tripartite tricarboxylate transporter substrate binding protein [Aquincola tertiaricarbonis]|uniref:Bug family tripartite tricarboxylate transporter substrate binding protein n=1 Tax=Aquincola tertiaricarbonis TaxID=391953 RepID=UPI000614B61C|nr:tripartite tricarboxylate transporter substrate binding protein [Aquincola tertiaricarbonis]